MIRSPSSRWPNGLQGRVAAADTVAELRKVYHTAFEELTAMA
jgi:hypothetical protein